MRTNGALLKGLAGAGGHLLQVIAVAPMARVCCAYRSRVFFMELPYEGLGREFCIDVATVPYGPLDLADLITPTSMGAALAHMNLASYLLSFKDCDLGHVGDGDLKAMLKTSALLNGAEYAGVEQVGNSRTFQDALNPQIRMVVSDNQGEADEFSDLKTKLLLAKVGEIVEVPESIPQKKVENFTFKIKKEIGITFSSRGILGLRVIKRMG